MNTLVQVFVYGSSIALPRATVLILSAVFIYKFDDYQMSHWSIATSLSSLYAGFIGLGLSGALVRWSANDELKMQDLIAWFHNFMQSTSLFVILAVSLLSYLFWPFLSSGVITLNPYLMYLLVYGLCEAYSRYCGAAIRLEKQPMTLLKFRVFQSFISLFVTLTLIEFQFIQPFAVFASSYFLATIPMYSYMLRYKIKIQEQHGLKVKDVLRFSVPATFQELSWWLKSALLTIIVATLGDDTLISGFFFSMLIVVPIGVLYQALDQIYEPEYYKGLSNNDCTIDICRKYLRSFIAISAVILLLMLTLPVLSSKYYFPYNDIVKVVSPIALFGMLSHGAFVIWAKAIFYNKRTDLLFYGSAAIIGITLTICYLTISKYGYIVAAITSASMFFFTAIFVLVISKILNFSLINVKVPIYTLILGVFILWIQFN